jgi:hypothetical protein
VCCVSWRAECHYYCGALLCLQVKAVKKLSVTMRWGKEAIPLASATPPVLVVARVTERGQPELLLQCDRVEDPSEDVSEVVTGSATVVAQCANTVLCSWSFVELCSCLVLLPQETLQSNVGGGVSLHKVASALARLVRLSKHGDSNFVPLFYEVLHSKKEVLLERGYAAEELGDTARARKGAVKKGEPQGAPALPPVSSDWYCDKCDYGNDEVRLWWAHVS